MASFLCVGPEFVDRFAQRGRSCDLMLMMQDRKRCRSFRSALADSTMAARIARTENSAHSVSRAALARLQQSLALACALGHRFSLASLTMKQASLSSSTVMVRGSGE